MKGHDMTNNYVEQLGQRVRQKSVRGNINLVTFLAIRDEVTAALEAGYSVKAVWADMVECKRTEIGYEVFLHYVNRLIRGPKADRPTTRATPKSSSMHPATVEPSIASDGTTPQAAKATQPPAPSGFTFNPVPNDKELF
jgi:hypothetical protein